MIFFLSFFLDYFCPVDSVLFYAQNIWVKKKLRILYFISFFFFCLVHWLWLSIMLNLEVPLSTIKTKKSLKDKGKKWKMLQNKIVPCTTIFVINCFLFLFGWRNWSKCRNVTLNYMILVSRGQIIIMHWKDPNKLDMGNPSLPPPTPPLISLVKKTPQKSGKFTNLSILLTNFLLLLVSADMKLISVLQI